MTSRGPQGIRILLAFAAAVLALPGQLLAAERAALPENDRYAVLANVQAMHRARCPGSSPCVTVFEVGGGDPAMNGAFLYLRLEHNDRSFVWKTGLNVRRVLKMSVGPGDVVVLRVSQDEMDSRSAIVQRTKTYRIRYHLDGDVLRDAVTVEGTEEASAQP